MKKKILSIMLSMVFAVTIASTSVFNTKVVKANEMTDVLVGTKNLNNTSENSAKPGDKLNEPEKGWKRYDNANMNIESYDDEGLLISTNSGLGSDLYKGTVQILVSKKDREQTYLMRFKFKGTKFRIINTLRYGKMKIMVDGKEDSLNQYFDNKVRYYVLSYEKKEMEYGEHLVEIGVENSNLENKHVWIDAIDIGEDGEFIAPIQLNKSSTTLPVGASEQLTASVLSEKLKVTKYWSLNWSSSDKGIVKVDSNGKITAVKEGKAIITARVYAGAMNNILTQCEVTVTNGQVAVANSISLDQNNVLMGNSSSLNLKATVSPSDAINKKVVWTSSNENIATVDQEGNVKSVGYGQVVITAKIENTDIKATCDVEVSEI